MTAVTGKRVCAAILGLAGLYTLILVGLMPGPVFFSGDGGFKLWIVERLLADGYSPALAVPEQPWMAQLWADGLVPVTAPFVADLGDGPSVTFSLPFLALSGLPNELFGWRGLFLIPLLALWATWWVAYRAAARAIDAPQTATLVTLLIVASYLTLYGAMFWEHTLAVALVALGLFTGPLVGKVDPRVAGAVGVAAGAASWLRPEAGLLAAILAVAGLASARARPAARWSFLIGVTVAIGLFVVHNLVIYGVPLGAHGEQVLDGSAPTGVSFSAALERGRSMGALLVVHAPAVWAVLALTAVALVKGRRLSRSAVATIAVLVCFAAVLPVIVPNAGGKQWGPRYLLVAVPLLWFLIVELLGQLADSRRVTGFVLAAVAVCGLLVNGFGGASLLIDEADHRIHPLMAQLEGIAPDAVAVTHQDTALELGALWQVMPFVRAISSDEAGLVADAMVGAGLDSLVWVFLVDQAPSQPAFAVNGASSQLRCRRLTIETPDHVSFDCEVVGAAPSAP